MLTESDVACLKLLKSKRYNKKTLQHLLDDRTVKAISECALNVLRGKVKLSSNQKSKLKKYKKEVRYLVGGKNKRQKKKVIVQKGAGFLPFLIGPAISLITSLLTKKSD
jgi:hypothetical protein